MTPLYMPKGRAREYGDLAVNIYIGCPHRCYYCFAPHVLHRDREKFHSFVEPRPGLVEALKAQLDREQITGQTVHLCFTCDPYPVGIDNSATREVITALKDAGNHVQILTKGDGRRDFDLLDGADWYGVTISCSQLSAIQAEPDADLVVDRIHSLRMARYSGIKTWISFEPVLNAEEVLGILERYSDLVDRVKFGKLTGWSSDIDWADFVHRAEVLCRELDLDYSIKDSLRGGN